MHFTSLILATGLAANAAALPALFGNKAFGNKAFGNKVEASGFHSFKPTGTGFPGGPTGTGFPGAFGTGTRGPHPTGTGFPSGDGFNAAGFPGATDSSITVVPFPTRTESSTVVIATSTAHSKRQFDHAESDSGFTATFDGLATRTGTFPTSLPSGGGDFAFTSGGSGFGGGSAQPTGGFGGNNQGSAQASGGGGAGGFGGGNGASQTNARQSGFGNSARPTGNGYSVHSRNTIPAARRGWFF